MRRTIASLATVLLAATGLGVAQPAQATGGSEALAVSSLGRVSFTAADSTYDGRQVRIPLKFAYEKWGNDYGDIAITVELRARQEGARATDGGLDRWVSWWRSAAQKGTGDAFMIVRDVGNRTGSIEPTLIYGSATFQRYDNLFRVLEEIKVEFEPVVVVTAAKEATTLTNVRVGPDVITGQATVQSGYGAIGAGGYVAVRYRAPRERRWTYITDFIDCPMDSCLEPDPMGNFRLELGSPIPPRSQVEVSTFSCYWCTDAKQTVTRGA